MTVPTRPPTHYGWPTYRLTAQLEPCAYQYLTQLMHHTGDGAYCTLVGDLNILLAPARSGKANILSRSAFEHVHAQPMFGKLSGIWIISLYWIPSNLTLLTPSTYVIGADRLTLLARCLDECVREGGIMESKSLIQVRAWLHMCLVPPSASKWP